MRYRVLTALAAVLLLRLAAFADDSPMSLYGGSARVMDESLVEISMDSETVLMSLGKDGYDVRVTFRFFNHGASTTVPVGFPVVAPTGFKGGPGPITDFATWVDGTRMAVRSLKSEPRDAERYAPPGAIGQVSAIPQALRWLVADLSFPAGRMTTVRVRYRAAYDPDPPWSRGAQYLFGTGAAWKGPIGSALFIVDRDSGSAIPVIGFAHVGSSRPEVLRLSAFTTAYRFSAIKPPPTASLEVSYPNEELDEPRVRDADGDERPQEPRYQDWRFTREPVTDAELEALTYAELQVFRNAFYAGHGRVFADQRLRKMFRGYSWYTERPDFKESDLGPVEKRNVRKILLREERYQAEVRDGGRFDLGEMLYPISSGRHLLDDLADGDLADLRKELKPIRSKADAAYLLPTVAPLWAARGGQTEALGLLLNAGADPNVYEQGALREAACAGDEEAVALLLKSGALIGRGAFNFWKCPTTISWGSPQPQGPLGHPKMWMELLKRFARDRRSFEADGGAVLLAATRRDWSDGVRFLVKAGAPDSGGAALENAALNGRLPLIRLLTGAGVAKEDLSWALLSALLKDQLDAAALLIEKGADVNMEDRIGRTPLIVAAWLDDPEQIALLLGKGADPLRKNFQGRTALQEAEQRGCARSIAALRATAKRP